MTTTLYEKLKAAETVNEEQVKIPGEPREKLGALEMVGVSMPVLPDAIAYDIATVQRGLLDAYRENPLMRQALAGEISIEDAARRLGAGRERTLPRRRDDTHNAKVAELAELVPHTDNLLRRGVFRLDNALAAGLVVGGPIAAVFYALGIYEGSAREAFILSGLAVGEFGSLAFLAVDVEKASYCRGILEDSCYLDGKIREFYQ